MCQPSSSLLEDLTEAHIREEFDEDVRDKIIEMDDANEALVASNYLKKRGNQQYRLKEHKQAIYQK